MIPTPVAKALYEYDDALWAAARAKPLEFPPLAEDAIKKRRDLIAEIALSVMEITKP